MEMWDQGESSGVKHDAEQCRRKRGMLAYVLGFTQEERDSGEKKMKFSDIILGKASKFTLNGTKAC